MIRAKSQYLPPDEKTSLETSYSATFKGQAPLQPADNTALERRRIRSLYSEPHIDPTKQVRIVLTSFVAGLPWMISITEMFQGSSKTHNITVVL